MVNARQHLASRLFLLPLLAWSAGCDGNTSSTHGEPDMGRGLTNRVGGQTGDEGQAPWTPSMGPSMAICAEFRSPEVLELEQDSELGFSAADILGFVAGNHQAHVRWNARPPTAGYAVRVTPGGVDETLQVTIRPRGRAC